MMNGDDDVSSGINTRGLDARVVTPFTAVDYDQDLFSPSRTSLQKLNHNVDDR
jgi:hypothetical protein